MHTSVGIACISLNTSIYLPLLVVTFLIFILENKLFNMKDVKFHFRMGCIPVFFQFLWTTPLW